MKLAISKIRSYQMNMMMLFILVFISTILNFKSPYWTSCYIAFLEFVIILFIARSNNISFINKLKSAEHILIVLFLLSSLISTLSILFSNMSFSDQFSFGLTRYIFLCVHVIFGVSLFSIYTKTECINNILRVFSYSLVIYMMYITYDYGVNYVGNFQFNSLPFITNRRYAGYIAMAITVYYFLSLFINKIAIESNLEKYVMFIVNFSFVIWLGGRAAIASIMVTFLFVMIIAFVIKEFVIRKVFNILCLMIFSCFVSIPFSVFPWNGMNRLFFNIETNKTIEQFANGRFELWVDTWSFIVKKPMLGYGADAYRFTVESGHYQPHNFVLQILLEFGIIGGAILGVFFLILLYKSIYLICKYKQTELLISVSIVIALFGHAILDGTLYHSQPVMLLSILCSYLAYNNIDKADFFHVKEFTNNNPN